MLFFVLCSWFLCFCVKDEDVRAAYESLTKAARNQNTLRTLLANRAAAMVIDFDCEGIFIGFYRLSCFCLGQAECCQTDVCGQPQSGAASSLDGQPQDPHLVPVDAVADPRTILLYDLLRFTHFGSTPNS